MKGNCVTRTYIITSPIGELEIVSCDKGLHTVHELSENDARFSPDSSMPVQLKSKVLSWPPAVSQCVAWFTSYFNGYVENLNEMPSICKSVHDGSFREEVRQTLRQKVTFGQTVSYGQLATLVGRPGASRAVGSAMRRNPWLIIVPCHRVIKANGELGQYAGGSKMKKWLQDHEKKMTHRN